MMSEAGEMSRIGRQWELLKVVGDHGDRAMNFIWKHKAVLATGAVLTAFIANPEPFIDGTKDITQIVAENVGKPLAEIPGRVAGEAARNIQWTPVAISLIAVCGLLSGVKSWRRRRVSAAR